MEMDADNGAWLDAYPCPGTTPFRGEKSSAFDTGWRVPGIMWWPGHILAGATYGEMRNKTILLTDGRASGLILGGKNDTNR